ncbi:MAG: flagellar basal body P-ring formation chaperone FlgA, partial [Planctomycetota bacterium]|nr:flagellar basal body P-ring formation chaperone FlgA [Planctomycetota bacterium]
TVPVVAEVTLLRDVVVARKPINRGQTIVGRHVRIDERRFDDLSKVGITELSAVIGKQSRRFVRQGQMLSDDSVEIPATVLRGESVTIWHRGSGLQIKTSGKALEAGRLGSRIRVRRDGARRSAEIIDATVTGPGTVELVTDRTLVRR